MGRPRKDPYFNAITTPIELKRIGEKVDNMDIEEIENRFPEELFKTIYKSFLIIQGKLRPKEQLKERREAIEYFLSFLKDKKSLEALNVLRNMRLKREKGEKKKPRVKWSKKKEK